MGKLFRKSTKNSISIRQKLIFSYVLLLFICVVLYTFFSYWNSSRYLKKEKTLLYTNSATSISQNIKTQLENYSVFATIVSSDFDIQRYLFTPPEDILEQRNIVNDTIVPLLHPFQVLNPSIHELVLYTNTTGNMIQSNYIQYISPEELKIDASYHYHDAWQYRDNTFILHTPIFYIYNSLSEPVGLFEIVLDAPSLFQSVFSNNETGLQMKVFTEEGNLVWSSYPLLRGSSETDEIVPITRIPIENTTLTADFYVPAQQFDSGISNSTIKSILPLLGICLTVSAIFIFIYSRSITNKIRTLTGIVNNIDQFNLDINIDMKQNDEVSMLADCLNEMLKRINVLISDIYEAKEAEKQAELDALRTQINPHFLYNTMDVVNWMALSKDTESICKVTGLISQYYRTLLNHGKFYTTFAEELSNIQSYISIQLIMHADSFDVQYDCDENLLQNKVPNFILQPAVENAIRHGIDSLSDKRGLLRIVLKETDTCILVDVCDNGVGLTAKQQQSINEMLLSDTRHGGYGLYNVNERIQLALGKEYGLTVFGSPGEGCITRFRLPKAIRDNN